MKRILLLLLVTATISLSGCISRWRFNAPQQPVACTLEAKVCPDGSAVGRIAPDCEFAPCPPIPPGTCTVGSCSPSADSESATTTPSGLTLPVEGFLERITKKPFGIYITPDTSPIQPERFSGYHTGVDAEFTDISKSVLVHAIADGTVVYSGRANGYGGVVAVRHVINKNNYVIVYGHLDPSTLINNNATIKAGERLGTLGDGYTKETDNERKHLHLSAYKGTTLSLAGYVKTESALDAWIDPVILFR